MQFIGQNQFEDTKYGNATLVENGCAVCCAAMLLDKQPEDVIAIWKNKYWDDSFGTKPKAFDNAKEDLGLSLIDFK